MVRLPKAAEPLVSAFSVAFTRPTFQRVLVLMLGAILSLRQRTVTPGAPGLRSVGPLGKVLAALVLELIRADQPIICPVDDTTPQHKGKHVYGNASAKAVFVSEVRNLG
jgi:hypothetical protein